MLRRHASQVLFLVLAAMTLASGRSAYGVDPNPLQSAYWRFEEGVPGTNVPANAPATPQNVLHNTVVDYANNNRMAAHNTDVAPTYVDLSLPPTALKSGLSNSVAWELTGGNKDVYTSDNAKIQNGAVGGKYDPDGDDGPLGIVDNTTVTGFTLEAAFNVYDFASTRAIVAKEGLPGVAQGETDPVLRSLPTMALKVRGPGVDEGKLQIELFDGAGDLKGVTSSEPLLTVPGQWYYAAAVNDGTTLSLYLDRNDGSGYNLEGSVAVNGALFQGNEYNDADWNKVWMIGRSAYGSGIANAFPDGEPADWFNGLIDEVRLTNQALDPSEFLFASTGLDGDFDFDDDVDGDDLLILQRGLGVAYDADDFADWRANFGAGGATVAAGAVPEPATLGLTGLAIGAGLLIRRWRN